MTFRLAAGIVVLNAVAQLCSMSLAPPEKVIAEGHQTKQKLVDVSSSKSMMQSTKNSYQIETFLQ